jgi:hypothetical protein
MRAGRSTPHAVFALLLLCLLSRSLIPTGWMPSFTEHGTFLVPCSGVAPAPLARPSAHDEHSGSHDDQEHSGGPKHDVGGQPCSFAAFAVDLPSPAEPAIVAELTAGADHFAKLQDVGPGQGLAAPPPPSTGPPTTA